MHLLPLFKCKAPSQANQETTHENDNVMWLPVSFLSGAFLVTDSEVRFLSWELVLLSSFLIICNELVAKFSTLELFFQENERNKKGLTAHQEVWQGGGGPGLGWVPQR